LEGLKKVFIQEAVPQNKPMPGAVIAVRTFGDFLEFIPFDTSP
jgi:hypothetical protein